MSDFIGALFERQRVQLQIIQERIDNLRLALDRAERGKRWFTFIAFGCGYTVGVLCTWWLLR